MTKSSDELKEIWRAELMKASEQIVMSAVTGQTLPQEKITVELVLAKPLVDALRRAAEQSGLDDKAFFVEIATGLFRDGIALKQSNPVGNSVHPDIKSEGSLNNPNLEMDKIAAALGDFQTKMNSMQEVLGQFKNLSSLLGGENNGNKGPLVF
jgi:hypothetical protein